MLVFSVRFVAVSGIPGFLNDDTRLVRRTTPHEVLDEGIMFLADLWVSGLEGDLQPGPPVEWPGFWKGELDQKHWLSVLPS